MPTESGSLLLKARTWTPVQKPEMSSPALATMTERQWELYWLSVVEEWQESPHKAAVIGAIKHKLMILEQDTAAGMNPTTAQTSVRTSQTPRKAGYGGS